jgi:hypothetical protein
MTLFGASTPDTAAPTVTITSPTDGAEYSVGDDFEIGVQATDDTEGTYEFYVEAYDAAGNQAVSDVVTIYVGVDAPPDPTAGGEEGGSEGGVGEEGGSEGGSADDGVVDEGGAGESGATEDDDWDPDDGALPAGFGGDGGFTECACTEGGPREGGFLLLFALGLLRRRRSRN